MPDLPHIEVTAQNRLDEVIASYLEAVERGESPDERECLARHPELARELSQFFDDRSKFHHEAGKPVPAPDAANSPAVPLPLAETDVQAHPPTTSGAVCTSTRYADLTDFKCGGLGALFTALDAEPHRDVVIKFIQEKCRVHPELLNQFKVEAEVTGRLDHPGVVPVYGLGQDWDGKPFYVMRMIHGRELRQAIEEYHEAGGAAKRSRANRQRLLALLDHLASACNTVAYAHEKGIIHCDLKPANIMIGKYAETFVLDWGLATSFERTATFAGADEPTLRPRSAESGSSLKRGGTLGYISPEQLSGQGRIAPASDVYSLGATLYEILTGRPPFDGRGPDVLDRILHGRFRRPREVHRRVSRRLEAICLKAMNLSPDERYRTAKQLADDLKNWMRDDEVQAAPDGALGRVSRLARRHRIATVSVIVAMLFGTAAGTWAHLSRVHARQEEDLRKIAESNFNMLLSTYENLCSPLANGELTNLGVFRELTETIEDFTGQYFASLGDRDSIREDTARVYELRATAARVEIAGGSRALADCARAERIFASLVTREPGNLDFKIGQARVQLSQGRLLIQRNEIESARDKLDETREVLDQLAAQQPDHTTLKRYLAEANHSLGEVCMMLAANGPRDKLLADAEGFFEEGKRLREDLVATTVNPQRHSHQRDLARSLGYLGGLYLVRGKINDAREQFDASLKLRRELYRDNPFNLEHRFQYARGLWNFGGFWRDYGGDFEASTAKLDEALGIQTKLVEQFSNMPVFAFDLGETLALLGEIEFFAAFDEVPGHDEHLAKARQFANEAAESYGRFCGEASQPGNHTPVYGLAESLVLLALVNQSSDPAESAKNAALAEEQIEGLGPSQALSSEELFTLALARSLRNDPSTLNGAWRALNESVERGQNAIARIKRHRTLGFRALSSSPEGAKQFDELLKRMRENVDLD